MMIESPRVRRGRDRGSESLGVLLCRVQPALRDLGLQRVDVEPGVVGPQVFLLEPHHVERFLPTTPLWGVAAPGLVLGNPPVRAELDDDASLTARVRLGAGGENRWGVLDGDTVADAECSVHADFFSSRARTSSIFAESSSGVICPVLINTFAATVAHRA